MSCLRARLRLNKQNRADAFDRCLAEFKEDPVWPWKGTTREDRLAPELLAEIYQSGRSAIEWGDEFFAKRGLIGTSEHNESSVLLYAVDHLMLHDRLNVRNSSAVEVMMRRVAGHQRQLTSGPTACLPG